MTDTPRTPWICATRDVPLGTRLSTCAAFAALEGVAEQAKCWPRGTVLKVHFAQAAPALRERTLHAARQWLVPGVQLDIVETDDPHDAPLRLTFRPRAGNWSYVGRDCLEIRGGQPTMNLGDVSLESSDDDFNSLVIHEFGHALGFVHEHVHPDARIRWRKQAVYEDLGGEPNLWDRATVDANVFESYERSDLVATPFDPVSVMIYPIAASWTTSGKAFTPSARLSDGDAETVALLYS